MSLCRELLETDENTIKAPNRPLQTDLLDQGATGHVKVVSSLLSSHCMAYKRPSSLEIGRTRSFPPSLRELLEVSAHPIVSTIHLQYQTAGRRAITSKEGPEPG
jgi:hypothetical protein